MRRVLPSVVMMATGFIVLLGQFTQVDMFNALYLPQLSSLFVNWASILFAFALVLGLLNLLAVHVNRIRQRIEGWPYSLVLVATVFVVLCAGLNGVNSLSLNWIFRNVQVPLQATLLSLLVFFIASAAFRIYRLPGSRAVLVMLAVAAFVLLGQMPLADSLSLDLVGATQWVRDVPAVAGARGIMLGVALGTIATGLRIILGLEREKFFS